MSASNKAGILLLRPIGHTRTEHQLRPGEGFAPDYRPVADRITLPEHAKHTPRLAVPPAWTAEAKPCDNKYAEYDEHRPTSPDESMAARAKRLCRGCPVLSECLEDAMALETETRSYRPDRRHGIRGGLTPSGRANLQRQRDEAEDGAVA